MSKASFDLLARLSTNRDTEQLLIPRRGVGNDENVSLPLVEYSLVQVEKCTRRVGIPLPPCWSPLLSKAAGAVP